MKPTVPIDRSLIKIETITTKLPALIHGYISSLERNERALENSQNFSHICEAVELLSELAKSTSLQICGSLGQQTLLLSAKVNFNLKLIYRVFWMHLESC